MAARGSLQVIGFVMASITAGVIMIAGVLVHKTATEGLLSGYSYQMSSPLGARPIR